MALLRCTVASLGLAACLRFEPAPPSATTDAPPIDAPTTIDAPPPADGWLHPWTHRKSVTIDATLVAAPGDTALVDFPVLVQVVDPQITAIAATEGGDLVFTAEDGVTVLASEVTRVTGDGLVVTWVKVPSLSATTNTQLYLYYGNPVAPPINASAAWTAAFQAVWHFDELGTVIGDATAGNHAGTVQAPTIPASIAGQVGKALDFDGVDDFVDFASMNLGPQFTLSAWLRYGTRANVNMVFANSTGGFIANGFRLFVNTSASTDRRLIVETGNGFTGDAATTNANAIPTAEWVHVAAAVDRTAGTTTIFIDGLISTTDTSVTTNFQTASDFELGRTEDGASFYDGALDEVSIASTLRPPEWIATAFRNQHSPSTFFVLGPQEQEP